MRAVRINNNFGLENMTFEEIAKPTPGPGQVLVKVAASPVNPSDFHGCLGVYPTGAVLPWTPGSEGSGTIVELGQGVDASWQDVNVAFISGGGAWAEYVLVYPAQCVKTGDNDLEQACCSFVNPLTVLNMADYAKNGNHKAVIHTAAASSLGKMMVRYFQEVSIPLINIVRRDEQVETLKGLGAEHILNSSDADFKDKLKALATELEATIAFDAVAGEMTGQLVAGMPANSTVHVYGGLGGPFLKDIPMGDLIFQGKTVKGLWLSKWLQTAPSEDTQAAKDKVQQMMSESFKTDIYSKHGVHTFAEALKDHQTHASKGKTLIVPSITE